MLAYLPAVRPDQTLTSWLLILCRNHGAKPQSLGHLLWPRCSIWNRDFDRTVPDSTLRAIAEVTGQSIETLESMTLREMVRSSGHAVRIEGRQAGLLPVGVFHRVRLAYGQQFCTACLSEPTPYLRREWRSEFAVACRQHGILLRDACPVCDAPFTPHRNRSLLQARCHRCLASLCDDPISKASDDLLRLQSAIAAVLRLPADSRSPSASELVKGLAHSDHDLMVGLRKLCRLRASSFRHGRGRHRIEWSGLRTPQRAAVLERVSAELAPWPQGWISWLQGEGYTQNDLEKRFGPWPMWIRIVMAQLPFSRGPTGFPRKRDIAPLRLLRHQAPNLLTYRRARAHLLLREAQNVQQALA